MIRCVHIDYTLRADVPIEELRVAVGEFVTFLASHPATRHYTSYQHADAERRFTHVGEFDPDQVAAMQREPGFGNFGTWLRAHCEAPPVVTSLVRVASTR